MDHRAVVGAVEGFARGVRSPRTVCPIRDGFFGGGSVDGELSDWLGRPVPPMLVFENPSISALAQYLVTGRSLGETPIRAKRNSASSNGKRAGSPIAVVGIGCRFPGASSPDAYWDLLREGRDVLTTLPESRRDQSGQTWASPLLRGGFLSEIDQFDARFFGISPREADEIDPQQRLLLEVAWETFENAGIAVRDLAGSRTGVFVGISSNDYLRLQARQGRQMSGHTATGNALAVASNRISYTFDFRGPSWAVDTACSSSLVAVHQAGKSLQQGECDLALAGGVSLILSPEVSSSFAQAGMLSPTGACHTFSALADGYVRGEGCGMILLKPLSKALADGDRIYGVLQGSAVSQDGRSNGMTAPNGSAQQAVIRQALHDAHITPGEIDYVEAHGTGTELGDPIEVRALGAVFAPEGSRDSALQIGSVKTNIGHLEAAAGIAGLIKVCLALDKQALPPHRLSGEPSPHIDWSLPLEIPTACTPWPRGSHVRRAGVSSFGFGGTIAHLILEEAPHPEPKLNGFVKRPDELTTEILTLSAKTEDSLREQAMSLAEFDSNFSLAEICHTANTGRTHFKHRLAVRAGNAGELRETLKAFAQTNTATGLATGKANRDFSVNWLFCGQGGQYLEAGKRLSQRHPIFREELDRCAEVLSKHWPRPLKTILWEDQKLWNSVDVQPAIFCLQYALSRLWTSWGIQPQSVLGHSLGEFAAACIAGVFSLDDALKLVTCRAKMIDRLPERGGMLAVFESAMKLRPLLSDLETEASLAAINGPRQTVIAGSDRAMEMLADRLKSAGIKTMPVRTTHAFHSPLVEPMLEDFAAVAKQIQYRPPQIPFLSSVTGNWANEAVACPEYWCRGLREPVQFYEATKHLISETPTYCLEMGAGSTLSSLMRFAHPKAQITALPGLTANPDEWDKLLSNLAKLYTAGADINWRSVSGKRHPIISLPTYAFAREKHWFADQLSGPIQSPKIAGGESGLALLGTRLDLSVPEHIFETDLNQHAYLRDHQVDDNVVFPTSGYLELALAAGESITKQRHWVQNLSIKRPLIWNVEEPCRVQIVLSQEEQGFGCKILRREEDRWQVYADCQLRPLNDLAPSPEKLPLEIPADGERLDIAEHYQICRDVGLEYGPAFQGLLQLTSHNREAWGQVAPPETLSSAGYLLHPAVLDSCLQVTAAALQQQVPQVWLPVQVENYRLFRTPTEDAVLQVHVELSSSENDPTQVVNLQIAEATGECIAEIEGLRLQSPRTMDPARVLFHEQWLPRIRTCDPSPTLPDLTPPQVEQHLLSQRNRILHNTGLQAHVPMLESLESLSTAWVVRTMRALRGEFTVGESFTTEELAEELGVVPAQVRLFNRLLEMLREENLLEHAGSTWTVCRAFPFGDPNADSHRLLQKKPAGSSELMLLQRCAQELPSILQGETDPLALLFPAKGDISAASVYRDSPGGQTLNALIAETVRVMSGTLAAGRGLRVLEIGAGTGATSEAALAELPPHRTRYTFTDIAPAFLAQAKNRFAKHPNMDFRALDIERDPLAQGFEPHTYDLIIAANVLHATLDLEQSLKNVRRLLRPGGQVLIVEGTRRVRWLDLTFGTTPGWWRFQDANLRADYPLLSAEGWRGILEKTGFDLPCVIDPLPSSERGRESENSILISRSALPIQDKVGVESPSVSTRRPDGWVVISDRQGVGRKLLEEFNKRREPARAAFASTDSEPRDVVRPDELGAWFQKTCSEITPAIWFFFGLWM